MALPDQRFIGWAMVLLAIAVFAVQVRYENGYVEIRWGRAERARMWPIIGMTVSALAFVGFGIWYASASYEGVQLKITRVIFDPNAPTEMHIDFNIANLGEQTTLEDWNLTVERY
jgi:hypothetical protein